MCFKHFIKSMNAEMYSIVFVAVILGIIGLTIAVPALLSVRGATRPRYNIFNPRPEEGPLQGLKLVGAVTGKKYDVKPSENEVLTYDFPFVTRYQWGARIPKEKTTLHTPVPYVVIHHSYKPAACYDAVQCKKAMQSMQNFHMDDREWWDIGYNFAVGSDGAVYEGRGWTVLGAHALHFNTVSLGICLIGDWTTTLPPSQQIKTAKALIAAGIDLGYVKPNYKVVGHRQVRDTECPGDTLFSNVRSWEHYVSFPATYRDLMHVKELPKEIRDKLANGNGTHIEI